MTNPNSEPEDDGDSERADPPEHDGLTAADVSALIGKEIA